MSKGSRSVRQPSYRRHKGSGQAVVTIGRRDIYLGKYGSKESKLAYKRLMLELLANDGELPVPKSGDVLVSDVAVAYKRHAKRYYVRDGKPTETYDNVAAIMQRLGESVYGGVLAVEFGPLALKAVRQEMIDRGQSRRYVNDQIEVIKRAFRWAASEQIIAVAVHDALRTVEGLRVGRSKAKETAPVQPVEDAVVDATIPFLPPIVDDMVRLLRLLGCRPTELCTMRPGNVDRSADVWAYRPERHKTELLNRKRVIFIGPKAQAILAPYLLRASDAFCFSPADSDAKRRALLHEKRKTPLSYGNRPGTNRARRPKCKPGDCYTHESLNRAIKRASDKADQAACVAHPETAEGVRLVPQWFPYQLRHTAATELRKRFGLEAAQVVLGHTRADVTQVYAERDATKAVEAMRAIG